MTSYLQELGLHLPTPLDPQQLGDQVELLYEAVTLDPRVESLSAATEGGDQVSLLTMVTLPDDSPAPGTELTRELLTIGLSAAPLLANAEVEVRTKMREHVLT